MNVVDSSAWLEYLAAGPNAQYFAAAIENASELVVPTVSIYEVFKRVVQQRSENEALQVVAVMQQGTISEMDTTVALSAARISLEHQLPMADSIMLATARLSGATLWTQDSHFEGVRGVKYRKSGS
ncbi:MAG: type II toxin-antitoxin system VapC family toxin [Spirochaetia bacterium]|jgi:predicted nucleic acid-binding protein